MGEEKEEKEGERERGEKWKTEGKSVHMSRELESYRTYMSLEPKLDLDPWELVQAEGTASMTLWNNGGTGQWEGKKTGRKNRYFLKPPKLLRRRQTTQLS